MPAQGIALGMQSHIITSPERAAQKRCRAPSGLNHLKTPLPGRCPGLVCLRAFGPEILDPRHPRSNPRNRRSNPRYRRSNPRNRRSNPRNRRSNPRNRRCNPRNRRSNPRRRLSDPQCRSTNPRHRTSEPHPPTSEPHPPTSEGGGEMFSVRGRRRGGGGGLGEALSQLAGEDVGTRHADL